jgi:hypothetical protein
MESRSAPAHVLRPPLPAGKAGMYSVEDDIGFALLAQYLASAQQ